MNVCEKCGLANTQPSSHRYINLFHKHDVDGKVVCQSCGHRSECLRCPEEDDKHSPCPFCGAMISNKYLKLHINVHVGNRNFACCRCLKKFKRKDTLLKHLRMHDGVKPYSCKHCPRQFRTLTHLRNHENAIHGIPGIKFHCTECSAVFTWPSNLIKHMRKKHVGKTPYACSYCAERFSTLKELMVHEEVHVNSLHQTDEDIFNEYNAVV